MKCFSLFFLLITSLSLAAQENFVVPKTNTTFTNGDRATLLIESELSDEELRKFENTKITDVIYVFSLNVEGSQREFEVIFSDPPKKKSEVERPFKVRGINYTFDKARAGDQFIFMDSNFESREVGKYLDKAIYTFLVFLLLLLIYNILKGQRELKRRKNIKASHADELLELYRLAKTRDKFELIFKRRKEFEELIEIPESTWKKLIERIDELQFRESWSDEELKEIIGISLKATDMRQKRGI